MDKKDIIAIVAALVLAPVVLVLLIAGFALSLPFGVLVAIFAVLIIALFAAVQFFYVLYALLREGMGKEEKPRGKGYSLEHIRSVG